MLGSRLLFAALFAIFALIIAYWQLVIAEGAYLGARTVALLYDLTARRYDRIKQFQPWMEDEFLGIPLAQAVGDSPDVLILDIATGTARLPDALLRQPGFLGKIVGVDSSLRMLEIAAEKTKDHGNRLDLIWKAAATLPFPDDTFDAVTCLEALEFTPDPGGQVGEAVRVLRPAGVLVTSRRTGPDRALLPGKTHSPEAFRSLLIQHGLRGVSIERWQVDYDLVWAIKTGSPGPSEPHAMLEILRCPTCQQEGFIADERGITCQSCRTTHPVRQRIIFMPI